MPVWYDDDRSLVSNLKSFALKLFVHEACMTGKRSLGVLLLIIVVFIWVSSSVVLQVFKSSILFLVSLFLVTLFDSSFSKSKILLRHGKIASGHPCFNSLFCSLSLFHICLRVFSLCILPVFCLQQNGDNQNHQGTHSCSFEMDAWYVNENCQ